MGGGQSGMPSSIVAMVNARNHRYKLEAKHQYMKALLGNTDEGDDDESPTKAVDELMQGQRMSDFNDEFNKHVNAFSWSHAASGDSFQQDENEVVQKKVVKKKVAAPAPAQQVSFESLFEPKKKKAKKAKKVAQEEREEADEPFSEEGPMARFLAKQQA